MGQRSQVYIRVNSPKEPLSEGMDIQLPEKFFALYSQWNFGPSFAGRAAELIESLATYRNVRYLGYNDALIMSSLDGKGFYANFDNIIEEAVRDCRCSAAHYTREELGHKFNDYVFEQDNNDGQLYVDVYPGLGPSDEHPNMVKYAFVLDTEAKSGPYDARLYVNHGYNVPEDYAENMPGIYEKIEKYGDLMTPGQTKEFRHYDYGNHIKEVGELLSSALCRDTFTDIEKLKGIDENAYKLAKLYKEFHGESYIAPGYRPIVKVSEDLIIDKYTGKPEPQFCYDGESITYMDPERDNYIKQAKDLITAFCRREYDSEPDFSDMNNIGIAYTDLEDGRKVETFIDLESPAIHTYVDGQLNSHTEYGTVKDLIDNELKYLDFDALVRIDDEAPSDPGSGDER